MAYEELVRRYQDVAVRTAHLISPDGDAEDAVQEAFVKAYAALSRFRPDAPFRPWILRIVANEARNRRRSAGRRAGLALRAAEDRRPGDAAPSPESAILAGETRAALLAAISGLRDEDREIIGARYFLDLSEAEAAEALGLPTRDREVTPLTSAGPAARAARGRGRGGAPWLRRGSSSRR